MATKRGRKTAITGIDFRLRPPYKSQVDTGIFWSVKAEAAGQPLPRHWLTLGVELPRSLRELSVDLMLSEMDEAGITYGCVLGRKAHGQYGSVDNDEVHELCSKYPDRLLPFAGIDVSKPREALKEIERTVSGLGFKGISIDPGWLDPIIDLDDHLIWPTYDLCQELNVPVLITCSILAGADLEFSNPVHIMRVARAFPRLNVVVSHGAFPWVEQIIGVAMACPNVWVSPDFYHTVPGMPGAQNWVDVANTFLDDRLLFGSGYPLRPIGLSVELFKRFKWRPEALENCMWKNAARLLKLPV